MALDLGRPSIANSLSRCRPGLSRKQRRLPHRRKPLKSHIDPVDQTDRGDIAARFGSTLQSIAAPVGLVLAERTPIGPSENLVRTAKADILPKLQRMHAAGGKKGIRELAENLKGKSFAGQPSFDL